MARPVEQTMKNLAAAANQRICVFPRHITHEAKPYHAALTQEKIESLIRLNVYSVTEMTYIVLPGMVER